MLSSWDEIDPVSSPSLKRTAQNSVHPLSYLYPTKFTPSKVAPAIEKPSVPSPQPQGKFASCIKSVKCRFMSLGVLFGLLLSLGAIVPIVVVWQLSTSKTTTTTSVTSSSAVTGSSSSSLFVSTAIVSCSPYFCEEQVIFNYNMTLVALSLTITVQRIGNTTYHNAYTTYSPILNSTYTTTSSQIIYQFFIQTGVLPAGNQTCAVQFHLNNVNQTNSADTYSMTTTNLCGSTNSAPSHF